MLEELRSATYPIYQQMFAKNTFDNICTFSLQWGSNFPKAQNSGLLFVGKAVNGWVTDSMDVDQLFDLNNPERIFAREDQMAWVNNLSGNTKGYNTRKSAFWRLIKQVSETYHPEKWYSNIAWTNLYKVAPWEGGNPNGSLQALQQKYCFELLEKEIETLSPEFVILLTSGWEWSFIKYLNNQIEPHFLAEKKWNGYKTSLVVINGRKFIISQHPQGKNEWKHKQAITDLIQVDF